MVIGGRRDKLHACYMGTWMIGGTCTRMYVKTMSEMVGVKPPEAMLLLVVT